MIVVVRRRKNHGLLFLSNTDEEYYLALTAMTLTDVLLEYATLPEDYNLPAHEDEGREIVCLGCLQTEVNKLPLTWKPLPEFDALTDRRKLN